MPRKRKRYASSRVWRKKAHRGALVATQARVEPVWWENVNFTKEWNMSQEIRKMDGCEMEMFGTLDISEKTIAILGGRWWPQTAKQEGEKMSKPFLFIIWKKGPERPNDGGVPIWCRNGAPSRKGCVVNG